MSKKKKAYQLMLNAPEPIQLPWEVARLFYDMPGSKQLEIFGNQCSIGLGDYAHLDEMRDALTWLVDQFGGKVTWDE